MFCAFVYTVRRILYPSIILATWRERADDWQKEEKDEEEEEAEEEDKKEEDMEEPSELIRCDWCAMGDEAIKRTPFRMCGSSD